MIITENGVRRKFRAATAMPVSRPLCLKNTTKALPKTTRISARTIEMQTVTVNAVRVS